KEVLEIKAEDHIFNESADKIVFNRPGTPEAIVKDETIPNVYLDEPSLLTVLGDKNPESKDVLEVKVSGFVWGWDNLDKVSFADEEIPFIAKKIEVKDGKEEVYSGEGFEFNGHVELGEGYHEIELKVSSEHKKDFGIGRRFWIDLTKPKVKGPATIYTNSSEANVEFRVIDNLHLIEVKREDNYITKIDTSGKQG
ncbi:hypothetical protein, partial [Histophilus somni]|uniref:hypothetical protein n=1 Tax=Histophilus somni TaxID=731 RepID=UPI00201F6BDA